MVLNVVCETWADLLLLEVPHLLTLYPQGLVLSSWAEILFWDLALCKK